MEQKTKNLLTFTALAVTLTIMVVIAILLGFSQFKKDDPTDRDYRNDLELKYWHSKSELVDEVQHYIDTNSDQSDLSAIVVVNACEEFNVDVRFVLAQGAVESHFGTRGLAVKTNSVWNVWAYDGLTEDKINKKGKFTHPDKSVRPYLELLIKRYLVGKTEWDLIDNFVDVDGNRYASYTKYEQELRIKLDEMKSTKMDSLIKVMHKQKLRLNR